MGCDIHDWAEVRQPDGRWAKAGAVFPNPFYEPQQKLTQYNVPYEDSPFSGRSYRLFAVLAGVRNDYGITPISPPRGVPHDVCPEILNRYVMRVSARPREEYDEDNGVRTCSRLDAERWIAAGYSRWVVEGQLISHPDWHSPGWLTLKELLAYDWNAKLEDEGWVNPAQYLEWKSMGQPSAWCRSVSGGDTRHVGHHEMERLISEVKAARIVANDFAGDTYTHVTWSQSIRVACREFLGGTLPALLDLLVPVGYRAEARQFLPKIIEEGDKAGVGVLHDWFQDHGTTLTLDDVRLVFWFDN